MKHPEEYPKPVRDPVELFGVQTSGRLWDAYATTMLSTKQKGCKYQHPPTESRKKGEKERETVIDHRLS